MSEKARIKAIEGKEDHEKLELEFVAEKEGYVYIYISNESKENLDVYFDDLRVTHVYGKVVAGGDYYPYGLPIEDRQITLDNYRFGYQGQFAERDEETGWNHFELREYDAAIGRWTVTDPFGQYWSPYKSMGNNPISRIDRTGGIDGIYVDVNTGQVVHRSDLGGNEVDFIFLVEQAAGGGYVQVGETQVLDVQPNHLVQFPARGFGFGRYSLTPDPGGFDASVPEYVGPGDHYVQREVAAKLFGLAFNLNQDFGLTIDFGDMSSSNGSDPWGPGSRHHGGHGHLGTRTGLDVDFRYLNENCVSFQDKYATTSPTFSQINNQRVYDRAALFGFHRNYHGKHGPSFDNASPMGGHDDHGHLGYGR